MPVSFLLLLAPRSFTFVVYDMELLDTSGSDERETLDDRSVDVNSEGDLWKVATLIMMNSDMYGPSMDMGKLKILGREDVTLVKEWARTGKVKLFVCPSEN